METKKKKLLLKKETVATLNDRSLHGVYGGTDEEEAFPTLGACTNGCTEGIICTILSENTKFRCTKGNCTADCISLNNVCNPTYDCE